MISRKHLVLFTIVASNLVDQPAPEVTIKQGTLIGKVSGDGATFEYVGIPYATTEGRFQAPLSPPTWKGIYKATDEHYQCTQAAFIGIIGFEDCLKINVYVPAKQNAIKPLPVMIYIHGGGYVIGNGGKMMYGADLLVKHDVVVVTFNYRLGTLGFLCLGIKEAPGNAGIKDQIAALRWVKENIADFGGDPDNVTIFGHSVGASSVSLLLASEVTEGLFNKAIVQSGSSLAMWSIVPSIIVAKNFARYLGYNAKDIYELYNIFLRMPLTQSFFELLRRPMTDIIKSNIIHSPCIENPLPGIEPAITDHPYNLIMNKPKNVSIIYGITDNEGMFLVSEETEKSLHKLNANDFPFNDMQFSSEAEAKELYKRVKEHYFGDKVVSKENIGNLSDMYGDFYVSVPTLLESKIMSTKINAPIYNYYFKYDGGRNIIKYNFCKNQNAKGATHADDILYLFNAYIWPYRITSKDQKIINWMTKMWTNFAKYGDPTPSSARDLPVKWEPSTKESMNFLYIDKELQMGPLPIPERYKLWKDIYEKYRKTKF